RVELLSMVRKQSKSLDVKETDDAEMDARFWREITDLYFVCRREPGSRGDDDLIFLVKEWAFHFSRREDGGGDSPYFVRRWGPKLDELIGDNPISIDWRRSFFLNFIAHTCYSVTVAICSRRDIQQYQADRSKGLTPVFKVLKTVYASPTRVNFHLDSRKAIETLPSYPEICFAVDDFDSTFDSVVLTDADHCYCVLLNAHDGAAFPHTDDKETCENRSKVKSSKVTLFSGFISYEMVREAYDSEMMSGFGSIFSLGHFSSGKAGRVYMKGPGGRGEVEVAVSGVPGKYNKMNSSSPARGGLRNMVRTAASVASTAAKQAYAAAAASSSSSSSGGGEMVPLKCCLMSISLPWEAIAHDLVFQVSIY
ncbi:hypothetical protein M569_10317, partial [Genlisea aurea]